MTAPVDALPASGAISVTVLPDDVRARIESRWPPLRACDGAPTRPRELAEALHAWLVEHPESHHWAAARALGVRRPEAAEAVRRLRREGRVEVGREWRREGRRVVAVWRVPAPRVVG